MKREKVQNNISDEDYKDYIFNFKYVDPQIDVNPESYDEDLAKYIKSIVQQASRDIAIDFSYVSYEGSKYEKTFLIEDGWKELCSFLKKSKNGKVVTKEENNFLRSAYAEMIEQYLYQFVEDLGFDIEDISIEVDKDSPFIIEISQMKLVDNYRGKWQFIKN